MSKVLHKVDNLTRAHLHSLQHTSLQMPALRQDKDMKRHEASHNGERGFICAGCEVSHVSGRPVVQVQLSKSWGCDRSFSREDGLAAYWRTAGGWKCVSGLVERRFRNRTAPLNGGLGNIVDARKSFETKILSFHISGLGEEGSASFLSCCESQGSGATLLQKMCGCRRKLNEISTSARRGERRDGFLIIVT